MMDIFDTSQRQICVARSVSHPSPTLQGVDDTKWVLGTSCLGSGLLEDPVAPEGR
jgi:hypothetical protein